ncbi:MAG: acyl-CoA dehydrogenase [Chloroflexi bacterium]|nr:acyl-CoA dehydrogenase [Chloroflexota bacterium]
MDDRKIRKGGSFLIEAVPPSEVFTPEDFGDEHRMIASTMERFVKNEVMPHAEKLEHKDFALTRKLMKQAGELGLLGADIEDEYGGSKLDSIASLLITESSSKSGSFGVTLNCHIGIGSMPIVYFGSKAQKKKYLPGLAKGEKIGAYALTEPGAGTDAMSLKTTAKLTPDGKYYVLNGTKQFITNGAFCDIIFTYAKTEGDKMTAFILERGYEGISTGPEEKKLGIRGSSTCSIFLDSVRVPLENVLFEVGKGHAVVFNILDLGRFKLAAASLGAAKLTMETSVKYAKERVQFNKPICQFGLIKHKLAEMAAKTYMLDSMVFRTGGMVEQALSRVDHSAEDADKQSAKSIAEYAVECSINKIYGSEMMAYLADEAIQIHGGYGYVEEYLPEKIYRDTRITRIFEGTNEINRLIATGWLLRKALKNEIPLFPAAEEVKGKLSTMGAVASSPKDGALGYQSKIVERAKKIYLYLAGAAAQKYGMGIEQEQEVLGLLADIAIEIYAMESGLLRALKAIGSVGEKESKTKIQIVQLYVNDAMVRIRGWAEQVMVAVESADMLAKQLAALNKITQFTPVNGIELRRAIADRMIEAEGYAC